MIARPQLPGVGPPPPHQDFLDHPKLSMYWPPKGYIVHTTTLNQGLEVTESRKAWMWQPVQFLPALPLPSWTAGKLQSFPAPQLAHTATGSQHSSLMLTLLMFSPNTCLLLLLFLISTLQQTQPWAQGQVSPWWNNYRCSRGGVFPDHLKLFSWQV